MISPLKRPFGVLAALLLVIAVGAGAFFGLATLLGIAEMREILRAMRRKLHAG